MSIAEKFGIKEFTQSIWQRYCNVPPSVYKRALSKLSPRERQTLAWLHARTIPVPEGHTVEYTLEPLEEEPDGDYLRGLKKNLRNAIHEALEEIGDKLTEKDLRFIRAREQSFDLNALLDRLDDEHKFIFVFSFGFEASDQDLATEFCNGSMKRFNRYIREIEDAITETLEEERGLEDSGLIQDLLKLSNTAQLDGTIHKSVEGILYPSSCEPSLNGLPDRGRFINYHIQPKKHAKSRERLPPSKTDKNYYSDAQVQEMDTRAAYRGWYKDMPTGDTTPIPVTTTRLITPSAPFCPSPICCSAAAIRLGMALDIVDGVLHRPDLFGVLIRDLDPELLLQRHH